MVAGPTQIRLWEDGPSMLDPHGANSLDGASEDG